MTFLCHSPFCPPSPPSSPSPLNCLLTETTSRHEGKLASGPFIHCVNFIRRPPWGCSRAPGSTPAHQLVGRQTATGRAVTSRGGERDQKKHNTRGDGGGRRAGRDQGCRDRRATSSDRASIWEGQFQAEQTKAGHTWWLQEVSVTELSEQGRVGGAGRDQALQGFVGHGEDSVLNLHLWAPGPTGQEVDSPQQSIVHSLSAGALP